MVCDPITDDIAGALVSAMRFSHGMLARGHNVSFLAAKSHFNPKSNIHSGMKMHRFPSILVPKSDGRWHITLPSIKKIKKIIKEEEIDVVHVILPLPSSIMAIKAARSMGVGIVSHSHSQPENLFESIPKFLGRSILNQAWYKYLSYIYGKADVLVCPSQMAKEELEKVSKNYKDVHVISNGVNIAEYRPLPVEKNFYDRYQLSEQTKKIIYVGRLFPEKSIDTLIKAIPSVIGKHPDTEFILVGQGYLREKLETLAQTLGVQNSVKFLGKISDEDKILAYNASDIFVLPSLAELEGMVVLEAKACGKPIIISDSKKSASRFFVDGNGLLFETKNHEDLAKKIIHLLGNEELRGKMGKKSLENSRKYDIEESINRLEKIYYSISKK